MSERLVRFQKQTGETLEPVNVPENASINEKIIAVLRNVYDPEIPVNIYDLGLIYGIDDTDPANVRLKMTLTSPHCPVAESLPVQVQAVVKTLPEVEQVSVELVWDPPWSQERMSEDARLLLDMF